MKVRIMLLVAVLLLALGLAGCSKDSADKNIEDLSRPAQSDASDSGEETKADKETDTDSIESDGGVLLSEVRSAILEKCEIADSLPLETEALERLYGIDTAGVKQSAGFVTMSGTFPHEVIMIEAVDNKAADEIVSKLQNRHSEVMVQSKSYDAKNYALALECKVVKDGNFISMFLSPDHKKITEVYNEYIK